MALGVTQREGLDGAWLPLGLGEKPEGECCLSALPSPGIPPSELRGKKGCSFTKRLLCTGTVQSRHGNREVEPEGNRWEKTPQSSGWDLSKDTPPVCGGATALTGYLALGRLPPFSGPQFPPVSNEAN